LILKIFGSDILITDEIIIYLIVFIIAFYFVIYFRLKSEFHYNLQIIKLVSALISIFIVLMVFIMYNKYGMASPAAFIIIIAFNLILWLNKKFKNKK
jgi:asparagine N-glycosylation enzyme membrane subunit Stt3